MEHPLGKNSWEVKFLLASIYLSELASDIFRMNQIRIGYSQKPRKIPKGSGELQMLLYWNETWDWLFRKSVQRDNIPKSVMLQLKKLKERDVF